MADGDFKLISSAGVTIDLNALTTNTSGVQAIAGLTGFGLPSADVKYQVGAGDGATYRGQRFNPRDIDVPIFIAGATRAALRSQINTLVIALAGECRLQWEDGSKVWEVKVRRVGGGEFVYGTDTNGDTTLQTTITLRSGDPYWRDTTVYHIDLDGTGPKSATIPAANFGNAPAAPKVTVNGPTLGFTIAPSSTRVSEGLVYSRFIPKGQSVVVDFEKGTVQGSDGTSLYGNLAPNPRFFKIDPIDRGIYCNTDTTSAAYQAAASTYYYNYLVNPNFDPISGGSVVGWTDSYFAPGSYTATAYGTPNYTFSNSDIVWVPTANRPQLPAPSGGYARYGGAYASISGLTVGRNYRASMFVTSMASDWSELSAYFQLAPGRFELRYPDNTSTGTTFIPGTVREDFTFTATGTDALLFVAPPWGAKYPSASGQKWDTVSMSVGRVILTEVENDVTYFDGGVVSPPTNAGTNSWTGTANNSKSQRALFSNDTSTTGFDIDIYGRNWMVI